MLFGIDFHRPSIDTAKQRAQEAGVCDRVSFVESTAKFLCTPNSLSQEVGRGLGAQAGEATLSQVFSEAGFTRFRRATQTPFNLILEARK